MAKDKKTNVVFVDGERVQIKSAEFVDACSMTVSVGTNGEHGGDAGHGCRTFLRIRNDSGAFMHCTLNDGERVYADDIIIDLGGDAELRTFVQSLNFAVENLGEKVAFMPYYEPSEKQRKQENFRTMLIELCKHFASTGSLRHMSEITRAYHVSKITKQQFFECGLHEIAKSEILDAILTQEYCNSLYEYVLGHTETAPKPKK